MSRPEAPQNLLKGFQYADPENVLRKLADFAMSGPDTIHVVSDFDLTLTAGKLPGQNLGTWDVMDALMPPEGVEKHSAIYNSFRPIELEGKLTSAVAQKKWAETLDLITGYHMNIDDVEEAFLSVAMLRDGAKGLFTICERFDVPTVILSSGIRNVIQLMTNHYKIHPAYILSNELTVDRATHQVNGWQPDTLIHMLNKNEMGHNELSTLRKERPNVVLLGDVPDDAKMVTGNDVIRIRVIDPRKGEMHSPEVALQKSFEAGYDLVVEHSLRPVATVMAWLVATSHV
jgi:2-hydroxy-3-keto-5-methylthiopentenyl-1-phosphate phosphatase